MAKLSPYAAAYQTRFLGQLLGHKIADEILDVHPSSLRAEGGLSTSPSTYLAQDTEASKSEAVETEKVASHTSKWHRSNGSPNTADGGCMIKLNSSNYYIWKPQMRDLLYSEDLYDPIEWGGVKPSDLSEKSWETMNRKTVGLIKRWIDESVFYHVAKETNAHSLWMKLASLYEPRTALNKVLLFRRLVNMKYREGDSMVEYLSSFQGLINELEAMNLMLNGEVQALMLLCSLPDSWESMVLPLCISAPNGKITLSMVKSAMLNEEIRRKDHGFSTRSEASVVEQRERCKSRSAHNSNALNKSRGRSEVKKDTRCFHCGKIGHIKRQCRMLKR